MKDDSALYGAGMVKAFGSHILVLHHSQLIIGNIERKGNVSGAGSRNCWERRKM